MGSSKVAISRRTFGVALIVGGWLWAGAGVAQAQDYVRPPCSATAAPRFEDHLQSLWYRRFWTGDCKDLPAVGCRSGQPFWNQIVQTITARAPMAKRADVSIRVCKLGRRIGFEWTRPKAERRIDTGELQKLNRTLQQAPDVTAGLTAVEASVREKTGP